MSQIKGTKAPTPKPGQVGTVKVKPVSVVKSSDADKRNGTVNTRKGSM
jgi:hypothetical protein